MIQPTKIIIDSISTNQYQTFTSTNQPSQPSSINPSGKVNQVIQSEPPQLLAARTQARNPRTTRGCKTRLAGARPGNSEGELWMFFGVVLVIRLPFLEVISVFFERLLDGFKGFLRRFLGVLEGLRCFLDVSIFLGVLI